MALAAVLDPVEKNSAVVFYYSQINSNYNLAMRLFSLTGGSDSKYTDFNTANSSATPSSALAAATFLGDIRVYGVASVPKVSTSPGIKVDVITQLSPVFNPIDKPAEFRVQVSPRVPVAACQVTVKSQITGYVSYLNTLESRLQIVTFTVTSSKNTPSNYDPGLYAQSKLAACAIKEKPYIFFQNSNKQVQYYGDGSTTTVKNTGGMALGSQLGATTIGNVIYVYFRNNDNKLVRVQGEGSKWSAEQGVSSHEINADSSIALVVHKTSDGESNIHHFFWSGTDIIHESIGAEEQMMAAASEMAE
ncbi:hypothetical protein V8E54_015083 [Elaphomyces granulatus]|jgi:hypothetical protein